MASETTSKTAMEHGLKTVEVTVKGPGPGRESAIRALQSAGFRSNCNQRRYSSTTQRLSSQNVVAYNF